MLACFGVREDEIRGSWTIAQWMRHKDFALNVWLRRLGGGH